ncbi:MAG: hypothetical protein ACM3Q2_11335, partial [Syntrophothermus sp.]
MKITTINDLVFCLAGISIFLLFQGCYTLVKNPDRSYSRDSKSSFNNQVSDSCVVEGIVHYLGACSTRELHKPSGYILDNIFWL